MLVAQPRRVAAISLAQRVAAERGEAVGGTVGHVYPNPNPNLTLTLTLTLILILTLTLTLALTLSLNLSLTLTLTLTLTLARWATRSVSSPR